MRPEDLVPGYLKPWGLIQQQCVPPILKLGIRLGPLA
jgi:hypothetical protein